MRFFTSTIFMIMTALSLVACGSSPGVDSADEIFGNYTLSSVALANVVDGELDIEQLYDQKEATNFAISENSIDLPTQEGDNTVALKNPTYVVQEDGTVDIMTQEGEFVTKIVKGEVGVYMRVSKLNMEDFKGYAFLLLLPSD